MRPALQPIETRYRGYRFRSRLEARWAVFFDALNIKWEYEAQGFSLNGVPYLPDFWLPFLRGGMFAEVKAAELTTEEDHKARLLCLLSGHDIWLCVGVPDLRNYVLYSPAFSDSKIKRRYGHPPFDREQYLLAVQAARGARFEYGESGYQL